MTTKRIYISNKPDMPLYKKKYLNFDEAAYFFDIDKEEVVEKIFKKTEGQVEMFLLSANKKLVNKEIFEDYLIDNGYLVYKSGKMVSTCKKCELSRMNLYAPRPEMPWYEKPFLTIDEASEYFNIGKDKIRELAKKEEEATGDDYKGYILKVGAKTLIRKRNLEDYLEEIYQI